MLPFFSHLTFPRPGRSYARFPPIVSFQLLRVRRASAAESASASDDSPARQHATPARPQREIAVKPGKRDKHKQSRCPCCSRKRVARNDGPAPGKSSGISSKIGWHSHGRCLFCEYVQGHRGHRKACETTEDKSTPLTEKAFARGNAFLVSVKSQRDEVTRRAQSPELALRALPLEPQAQAIPG